MKLSARNALQGTVKKIERGAVNGLVKIEIADGLVITSSITNQAIDELKLEEGKKAYAIIKASNVMIGIDD